MAPHPPFTSETAKKAAKKRHSRGPVPPEVKEKISQSQAARHAESRAAFPPLLVGWKVCTRCNKRKHYDFSNLPDTFASDYSPLKYTHADGSVTVRPSSRCKPCQAEVKAERYEQLSEQERRELSKKIFDQRDKDARREYSRLYDEKKRRERGVKPRPFKDGRNRQPVISVDAAPLKEFLQNKTRPGLDPVGTARVKMGIHRLPTLKEVANVTGLNVNHLFQIRNGRPKTVELGVVDKILTYFDCQHLLVLWYPDTNLEDGIDQ